MNAEGSANELDPLSHAYKSKPMWMSAALKSYAGILDCEVKHVLQLCEDHRDNRGVRVPMSIIEGFLRYSIEAESHVLRMRFFHIVGAKIDAEALG